MGEFVIRMPDIGEGIAEAEVAEWLVAEGADVAKDAPVVEVMTDKARVEIPSPVAGTVLRHGAGLGEFVAVGAELVRLTVEGRSNVSASKAPPAGAAKSVEVGDAVETAEPARAAQPASKTAGATLDIKETGHDPKPASTPGPESEPAPEPEGPPTRSKVLAAPAVRGRAQDAGVDLASVHGTGPEGRVTAADLDAHVNAPWKGGSGSADGRGGGEADRADAAEKIPMRGIRRITARRLQAAWQAAPHITIVEEVDVTELERLRSALGAAGKTGAGQRAKPTVLPFLIRAIVRALDDQPEFNAHFDDEAEVITQFAAVHVGVATQAPDGLKVPVLRNAEALDLWGTAAGVEEVSAAARDGRATREQLGGSTITVTSLGKLGAIATTPLVNKPEVAIVGVNRMAVRPQWDGSAFVPRTMMNLSCSFDHRVIDGWAAATFVARLKELLETPALIFVPA